MFLCDQAEGMEGCIIPNATVKSPFWVHFWVSRECRWNCRDIEAHNLSYMQPREMPYKNNTSNLFSHLERHHVIMSMQSSVRQNPVNPPSEEARQPSIFVSLANAVPLGVSSTRHKQLVDAVGTFVIQDLRALSVVEREGFVS